MAQATVQQAVAYARRTLLQTEGIVGVGNIGNTVVVYVETEADRVKVPAYIMGYPTVVRVVGRARLL